MATDTATLQQRLSEAEAALHQLQIGAAEVEIQKADRMVKFNAASVATLKAYIADLKSQLVALGALTSAQAGRRRAMNVVF